MKIIWKYEAPDPGQVDDIEMPVGAEIIKVHDGMMWAIIPEHHETERRCFATVATGQGWSSQHRYIGTFFHHQFVWHVLEVPI